MALFASTYAKHELHFAKLSILRTVTTVEKVCCCCSIFRVLGSTKNAQRVLQHLARGTVLEERLV
jgi:hypothetical protein